MLPLAKAELKKGGRRFSGRFRIILFIFAVISFGISFTAYNHGFSSDSGIYTSLSDVYEISNPLFIHIMVDSEEDGLEALRNGFGDVFVSGYTVYITESFKSKSAGDEMKSYIKREFLDWLYSNYGEEAFPVLVKVEYLERVQKISPEISPLTSQDLEKIKEIQESAKSQNEGSSESVKQEIRRNVEESIEERKAGEFENLVLPKSERVELYTPETLSSPSLLSKMVLAFLFLIPPFFVMQVFSSSLAEDVRLKRMEVLISSPIRPSALLFQKILPYFLLALLMVAIISLIFSVNGFIYMISPLLAYFSMQTFIALSSRSYRELTFLTLTSNLFLMIYLILPSVFTGIKLSNISPITFLLLKLSGEQIGYMDLIFSSIPLFALAVVAFYASTNLFDLEVLYSKSSPPARFVKAISSKADSNVKSAVFSGLFVFIALILEFFLLFFGISVPLIPSFTVIMFGVAFIEESLKSMLIVSEKSLKRAFVVSTSFFALEKGLLMVEFFRDFGAVLPGEFLIFPYLAHLISSSSFALVSRRSAKLGISLAVLIHFTYNYTVVSLV